ncbi:MAG: SRPBCC family protein [Novosphingobium sp.]|nr:SRPBCC family protein [Novosphingobium sp.]
MIETTQSILVAQGIDNVWAYAKDVERWAEIMPGYQQCEIIDDDNSIWVLKIGVGAMVRTVKVEVAVDRWAGPEDVDFHFALKGDPVTGGGTYRAVRNGEQTEVALRVEVSGTGPMAPMWEAMGGPVLPKFAAGFASQLKERIEAEYGAVGGDAAMPVESKPSLLARFWNWLRRLFG